MTLANFTYPGVRVVESSLGAIPLNRLGFRTMKLVGTARRGPINFPTLITRMDQFHDIFGARSDTSYLDDAVRAIIENAEVPIYVVRVIGTGAAKATKTLNAGVTPVLKIDALGPGTDYNYSAGPPVVGVSVTYVDGILSVYDGNELKEKYKNVVFGNAALSAQQINGQSNLIQITWLDTTQNPDNQASQQGLLGGTAGAAITASTYVGDEAQKTGIYAFATKTLPDDSPMPLGFLMCPGISDQTVGEALIDVAERFRGFALIDSTFGNSISQAKTERALYASSKGHALYCYGWVEVRDIDSDARKWVPRSPYRAAHIARSHDQPGSISNVGAGVDYRLRGVLALETRLDDLTQGELNELGIDVARNFGPLGYGLVSWNARTISPQVLFRFLQVRVILNVIAEALEVGLLPYVFRPFDGKGRLGGEIKASIDNLLWTFWNSNVLFGAAPRDAFLVKILPNLVELEQGVVTLEVYIKPTPIAERISVTLYRVPIYYNLTTGESAIGDPELAAA